MNILIQAFWLMEFVIIIKVILDLLKNDVIIGDIFGHFLKFK
jgi:hypothetical protein